jgi:hypothetical protein
MNDGTAEIIQLFGARPKPGKKISARSEPASRIPQPQSEEVASDTCSNQRLRAKRRDIWREADAVMDYWHLSLPAQPVDATQALNLSAGVSNCKVSRGRSFS